MKKKLCIFTALIFVFLSCSTDDEIRNNPFLPDIKVSLQINLDLPEYNSLNFPGNKFITRNYGINGIVVYNLNNDQYMAYELTDSNHIPQACSLLEVTGAQASCSCEDGNTYNIITGQPVSGNLQYSLQPYRVERRGNVLQISN